MGERKITIEYHSIVRDLAYNFWIIICAAIIGVTGSFVMNRAVYKPEYTSSATLIINSAEGQANAVAALMLSSEIASVYSEVFVQPTMKRLVCKTLDRQTFDGRINASVNPGTNIMELSVTASDPEIAYRELRAILTVYPEITDNLYSNGVVGVLRAANMPKGPSNGITSANMIRTALISAGLAAALIVALSVMRNTVKSEKGFSQLIDAKLLGVIPHERKPLSLWDILRKRKRGILLSDSAFTSLRFSENFNKIDSKLEYRKRTHGEQVFVVTSVAENEGKSTIASNLAISLAMKGNRVALVDLDGKKPALYKIFGQREDDDFELGGMLSGKSKKYRFKRYNRMELYLALNTKPHKDYQRWIENGSVERLLRAFRKSVDYVIVDTAPVSVDGAVTSIANLGDATILIVRINRVRAPQINDVIATLNNTGSKFAGCILNDVYDEFSMFSQMGTDESGYARYSRYSRYGHYGHYGHYGKYGRYGKYEKYSKYGKYGKYSKYSKYGKYGKYGSYGAYGAGPGRYGDTADDSDDEEEQFSRKDGGVKSDAAPKDIGVTEADNE